MYARYFYKKRYKEARVDHFNYLNKYNKLFIPKRLFTSSLIGVIA
ncbi:hypothetical protein RICGR_0816 [Rickettsiella grylli]|uniref:Uncharacterized protein n=1 Tax=Rickettsiella grylli TaxID=59196 RepID=A8PMS3_9COXI|nr:hypothetical protein RICGR_0816 [Rickettsiella grylli]